jgi:hypothetical protein
MRRTRREHIGMDGQPGCLVKSDPDPGCGVDELAGRYARGKAFSPRSSGANLEPLTSMADSRHGNLF